MTMIPDYELSAEDMRQATMTIIQEHITLSAEGYVCDTAMLVNVLIKAAVDQSSIGSACAELETVADSNTVREHLNQQLDVAELWQQEAEMNAALAANILGDMPRGGLELAVDLHDEPFYGKLPELQTYACRDRAQKGTTRFWRIASAYVIWRDVRLTLAVTYVLPEHRTLDVLKRLLQRVGRLGFHTSVLYLDKGFCSGEIIRYLQAQKQAAIIACPIRGKTGGTRALCQGRKSYRTDYTFSDGTTADVAVVATLPHGRNGNRRRKWLMFVVIELDWSPQKIKRCYRRRFGIECCYRQMRRVRIVTNSRNPALRFFVLGLALLLVNIWVRLRWLFCRVKERGRPRVDHQQLRLHRFIHMLMRAVEAFYGVVMTIPTHVSPQSVVY